MKTNAGFLTQWTEKRRNAAITGGCRAAVLTLALPLACAAQEYEALENIRAAAQAFAVAQVSGLGLSAVEASANNLDARLRLARCAQPLETFSTGAANAGRMTVGVRCGGASPWTLYVPVTIDAMAEVVSSSRILARGEVLRPGDLEIQRQPAARLPRDFFRAPENLVGMALKRPVRPGTILTLNMVEQPLAVRRGQEVIILARSGPLEVRMRGEALANGAAGELIQVRNRNSGRTVQALILDDSTVQVTM